MSNTWSRRRGRTSFVLMCSVAAVVTGCSGNGLSAADRVVTTTIEPSPTSAPTKSSVPPTSADTPKSSAPEQTIPSDSGPTTSAPPEETDVPGLWLSLGSAITDERGELYVEARRDDVVKSAIDDGQGGVIYLRCTAGVEECDVERVTEPRGTPKKLGTAIELYSVGTSKGRQIVLTAWRDPARARSGVAESDLVTRVIDIERGSVTSAFDWFGVDSGPFAADVESDQFVTCTGSDSVCRMEIRSGDGAAAATPLAGIEPAGVTALVLDPSAKVLTWIESEGDAGETVAKSRKVAGGDVTTTVLMNVGSGPIVDSDTNGGWAAVLVGDRIQLRSLNGSGQKGSLVAPDGIVSIALRSSASGGAEENPL